MPRAGPLRPLRFVAFAPIALVSTMTGWFLGSLLVLLQPRTGRWSMWIGRVWARAVLVAAGAHLEVEHAERFSSDEVRLIVGNHTSFLDPPAFIAAVPGNLRFILKKELARMPFIGWYCRIAGHFFLDRKDPRAGQVLMAKAVERAKARKLTPIIFPEGTRSPDGRLQPLKAGSFKLAVEGGFPVQPVAILGTNAIMPKGALGPRRRGRAVMRVGEPIPTADLKEMKGSTGRKLLAARTYEALLALGVPGPRAAEEARE